MNIARSDAFRRHGWLLPVIVFLFAITVHIDLPGLYMDAVNPDFVAAQKLHHNHLHNPSATLPSKIFPVLGSLYHGVQNFYVALPIFAMFGCNVASVRIAQALFGVVLIAAFFFVTQRLARSTALAMLGALGLATEIAFTASFRTQFYIVMGGATWLFVSLMLLLPPAPDERPSPRRLFWSGFFSGLAGYGYFVLLFFVPGTLAMVAFAPRSDRRQTARWLCGLAAGFIPYVVGYLSLIIKLHGFSSTLAFIQRMIGLLHPLEGSGTDSGNLLYAWQMARLAITNDGNDAMIFGHSLPSWWGEAKFYVFVACMLALLACCLIHWLARRRSPPWALIGLLPLSYLLVASLLGSRLWAHHFCVLVPFAYLLPISLLANLIPRPRMNRLMQAATVSIAGIGCALGNASQQYAFHENLIRSGGEGMSTFALTQMALQARHAPSNVVYLFPEWGFFTSFCLLTENRARYVLDASPETLDELKPDGSSDFRLVYWHAVDRDRYAQRLREAGLQGVTERSFATLDGRPVFYWLEAHTTPDETRAKAAHPGPLPTTPPAAAMQAGRAPAASPGTARPSGPAE